MEKIKIDKIKNIIFISLIILFICSIIMILSNNNNDTSIPTEKYNIESSENLMTLSNNGTSIPTEEYDMESSSSSSESLIRLVVKKNCTIEKITENIEMPIYINYTYCYPTNITHPIPYCYSYSKYSHTIIVQDNTNQCKKGTKIIVYGNSTLNYEKEYKACSILNDTLLCDDDNTINGHGDGNGDGICQSGETCYTYKLTDNKIELRTVYDGMVRIR